MSWADRQSTTNPAPNPRPPFPGTVLAAGMIWVAFGCLAILSSILVAMLRVNNANPGEATGNACCPSLLALGFVVCGSNTVNGKTRDTLGNAWGSILIGAVQFAIAGCGVALRGGDLQNMPEPLLITFGVLGLMGSLLIYAGFLALIGRKQYLAWRRVKPTARWTEADNPF